MDISKLSDPLPIDQIEFRLQSINSGGYAQILAYKDARADRKRLNEVVGHLGWKREHLNGNRNCIVSIWCEEKREWVGKEDTGTESNTEKEKGLASDSFKRACFNWGIGEELYDYPEISVKLNTNEYKLDDKDKDRWGRPKVKPTWEFKLKEWVWYSEFDGRSLSFLAAKDEKGAVRFKYGTMRGKKND